MDINPSLLVNVGVRPSTALVFAPLLDTACRDVGIDTRERVAAFLAQTMHESAGFTKLVEDLYYKTPEQIVKMFSFIPFAEARRLVRNPERLGNRAYARRLGNGDVESGDGFRFRGRGLIHLTARTNYRNAGAALRRPYEAQPDLVAQPADAVRTACWYWTTNGCNEYADRGDQSGLCRVINGPKLADLDKRTKLYARVYEALA